MIKTIGKEGTEQGEFNVMRLAKELMDVGIDYRNFNILENKDITIEIDAENETSFNVVIAKHIPEPLPTPPTKEELLEKELLNTKLAMAELTEKAELDKLQYQLALAETVEMFLTQKGGE